MWNVSRIKIYMKTTMCLHCRNFSVDTATFTKPMDFNVELLPLVARKRKILLDFMKTQKLVPAKSSQSKKSHNFVLANNSNNTVVLSQED